jgi:hypothetical protein
VALCLLSLSALLIGGSGTVLLVTILALPRLVRKSPFFPSWIVLSWLVVWFFSTPLYYPYTRLVLPFTVASCLISGFWISSFVREEQNKLATSKIPPILAALTALSVAAISITMSDASNPWRTSRGMAEAAAAMERIVPRGARMVVIGEPTLAFYLYLANRKSLEMTENTVARITLLENLREPVYAVTGVYAKRAPELKMGLDRLSARLRPLETFSIYPKDIRVLDDFAPQAAKLFRSKPDNTYDLTLYLVTPKTGNDPT